MVKKVVKKELDSGTTEKRSEGGPMLTKLLIRPGVGSASGNGT